MNCTVEQLAIDVIAKRLEVLFKAVREEHPISARVEAGAILCHLAASKLYLEHRP